VRKVGPTSLLALAVVLNLAVHAPAGAQDQPAAPPAADIPTEQSAPAAGSADAAPADADAADADAAPPVTEDEILVIADRLAGQIDAPEPPILELNTEDIAAYGAGSISELIQALSSQVTSGSGRGGGFPVMLVNGVRISSFRELRSYPPEAIEKVEVFSEQVAQRYGYSPDQRVVNFILKKNYSSREIELQYGQPWAGGNSTVEGEGTYLRLIGPSRLNFNVEAEHSSLLTEAERDIEQTPGSEPTLPTDPDPALYRSLVSPSTDLEATGNFTSRLGDGPTSISLNATFERNDRLSYQGLNSVLLVGPDPDGDAGPLTAPSEFRTFGENDPLTVDSRTSTYSLGGTLNTTLGEWQITGTADGSHVVSRSLTDRRADTSALVAAAAAGEVPLDAAIDLPSAGFDRADTTTDSASSKVTAMGRPVLLPGGEVAVTLDAGYNWTGIDSEDTRNPGVETKLSRGDINGGVNVAIPITSRREDFGAFLGDISLNLNGGIDELSDFGTLTDWSAGLNWSPTERLAFGANYVVRDAAPSLSQLGAPEVATFNVPVYDISRGETVLATVISGGNPDLPAQTQRDWRFNVNWQLPEITPAIQQARLTVEYFRNSGQDVSAAFPLLTPPIEAAFPDRVTRCGAGDDDCVPGQLLAIDQRPVTYTSEKSQRIQIGLNMTGPFGKARPQAAAAAQANNPFAMIRQATQPSQGAQGAQGGAPANGGQGPAGGPGPQAAPGGGQFNPQAFQQVRARFCTPEMANTVPTAADLAGLPEPLVARLKNPDGSINPERWAEARGGICNANFQQVDPARFAEMRERICGKPGETPPPITEEQLAALPPQMLERLKGPDGKIDPERVAQLRTRFCSANFGQGGPGFAGGPPQGGPGGPGGGPVIMQVGPGGGARGPGGGGGFFGPGGGGGDGRGRWFVNFSYTRELSHEVLVSPTGPLLDLLDGDALTGGGQPRDSVQFNGGLFYAGFGSNVTARYTGSSHIDGTGAPGSTDLFFGDYVTVDLRLFADLNQRTKLIEQVPLLKNTRLTFSVSNVFDARQRVTDSNGEVPLRYQPFLVDPVGRSFEIELRKLF
jgi:hypothetical protein